jgi:hypothetical protein
MLLAQLRGTAGEKVGDATQCFGATMTRATLDRVFKLADQGILIGHSQPTHT